MSMPTLGMDRGEPLSPEDVAKRVSARVQVMRALGQLPGADHRIAVHPATYEDIYLTVAPYPGAGREWWQGAFQVNLPIDGDHVPSLRCCGILMSTDTGLRYDEVVLRKDEPL